MNTCCFIGHRSIDETEALRIRLSETIEDLIVNEKVETFLFGSKSRFNSLCLETVTKLKEKYPKVKRVYVRAQYPFIDDSYREYLLNFYDETYYPENVRGSKAVYVERNREMIKQSRFCVFYYNELNAPEMRKSGTKIALDFAVRQGKKIINLPIG